MVIIGADGHAKEILSICSQLKISEEIFFFDNVSKNLPERLFSKYKIVRSFDAIASLFKKNAAFVLGTGDPLTRYRLFKKCMKIGGRPVSIISPRASIGEDAIHLGRGLNIMTGVVITNDISIGDGTLINSQVSIHHGVKIGKFCEISPGAHVTGKSTIGDFSFIGTGAILLPGVSLGKNVIVGAGAVVTKDIRDNEVAVGVPAKVIKKRPQLSL